MLSSRLDQYGKDAQDALRGPWRARRDAVVRAAVLTLVLKGKGPHGRASEVNAHLPDEWRCRSDFQLRKLTGGYFKLVPLLGVGGMIPPGALGAWTPDFWAGLRMSGALQSNHGGNQLEVIANGREALVGALRGDVPFHRSTGTCARGLLLWGTPAARLGPDDPEGVGVLAGLLAGGRRLVWEGRSWAAVANRPSCAAVFKSFGIPHVRKRGKGNCLLVSPFWGVLLSHMMPAGVKEWYRGWRAHRGSGAGMCPILPWAFVRLAWGRVHEKVPRGSVPFLHAREGLHLHAGVGLKGVVEEALARYGMTRVDERVRGAWLGYMVDRGFVVGDFAKVPRGFAEASGASGASGSSVGEGGGRWTRDEDYA